MTFSRELWQEQIGAKLRHLGDGLAQRRQTDLPYLAYGTVAGLTLWPLVEAFARSGRPDAVLLALYGVAGGVGANLVAEQLQRWRDRAEPPTEDEVVAWVQQSAPADPDLRQALDEILEKQNALLQAGGGLTAADREWLAGALREEMAQLGNLARFQPALQVIAGGDRAVAVGGNVQGSIITGDHSQVIERQVHYHSHQAAPQLEPAGSPAARLYQYRLYQQIAGYYSLVELAGLCYELGLNPEEMAGDTLTAKAGSLVGYTWRHGRIADLLSALRAGRERVTWPDPPAAAHLEQLSPSERLAQMPLDQVPPVSPTLPRGSHLPLLPNPHFTGREEELKELARRLRGGDTVAAGQSTAVTGAGGIGKSQLAVQFAYGYGPYFTGGVFWLNMSEPANVPAEVAACGGAAGMDLLPGFGDLPLDEQVERVMQAWRSDGLPRLLVFDNCEEVELLAQWRPGGACRTLVTARRSQWPGSLGLSPLRLPALPRTESIALLQKHIPDAGAGLLAEIATELGDLPLALSLAGGFMETYADMPFAAPAKVLARLRQPDLLESAALTGHGQEHSPTGRDRHVARTFALSLERLDEANAVDQLALELLARAACFAPGEPIPAELLLAAAPASDGDTGGDEMAALRQADALKRLADVGLLETGVEGERRLHRLVAAFSRQTLAGRLAEAQAVVEQIVLRAARQLNSAGYPRALLPWQSQLRHITDNALSREDEQAAGLCLNVGYHLQAIGDLAGARPYTERALAISEKALGPEHPDTAASLNNLGYLLQAMGDLVEARPYTGRALAIREKVLGPDHPDTAISLNNLGMLLQARGDLTEAQPYYERALAIFEKALGPDHPDTAISLNNLSALLDARGDLAGARPYTERALAIREKAFGPDHPDTAASLNNLGYLLQAMGDLAGARPYFERALAIFEKALGPDHPDTATTLLNLGHLLQAMGVPMEARPYYERALAIREKALGPDHPDTAISLTNLGALLQAMGNLAEAQPYYERALAIFEKALGPDHPDTAISLTSLGHLRQAMGDLAEARPYTERALAIWEKALGPDHPYTALSLNNLGGLLQLMGDLAGARPYFERALAIREKALGPDHSDTAASLNNLGHLLEALGDLAEARPYYERALAIREKALGPDHPDTALSLNNLGALFQALGDLAGARPYYERALAIFEKALGPDHPDTALSLNNLGYLLQSMGDLAGARPYFERALLIFEARLGKEHPTTQKVRRNLAALRDTPAA